MSAFIPGFVAIQPSTPSTTSCGRQFGGALLTLLVVAIFLATFSVARVFGEEANGTQAPEAASARPWDGTFRHGPLVLDPQLRLEGEWRHSKTAGHGNDDQGPDFSAKRVGADGQLGRRFAFEVSLELASSSPWRDLRAQYDLPAGLTIMGGQFKVPLGLDATRSAAKRDFVLRSRLADAYSLGRDQGVSLEARLWRKRVTIETGVFSGSSAKPLDISASTPSASSPQAAVGVTRVVRATLSPLIRRRMPFKDLRLGFSAASSQLSEGLSALALRSVGGEELTAPTYWARGRSRRVGADVRWRPGPFSATAEILSAAEERVGQGNRDQNLAPLRGLGWYVEGTWLLTGEPKAKDLRPRRPVRGGGPGALELVLRAERTSLGTPGVSAMQAASPRAEQPAASRLGTLTTGFNWYPAAGARMQFNVTRETLTGASATVLKGLPNVVSSIVRFQLFL